MRQLRLVSCLALVAALSACGGGGASSSTAPGGNQNPGGGTPPPAANTVTLTNLSFSPSSVTVPAGTTVTWKWNDCSGGDGYGGGNQTCVAHNVTFDDGVASSTQDQGTFTRTLSTKGTFKYHCTIHGVAMSGEVVVQ